MKKTALIILVLCLLNAIPAGCAASGADTGAPAAAPEPLAVDLDLSQMSGTVVYAQIYQILSDYQAYEGKIIRMKGWYDVFQDANTGMVYLSCIIPDATACCAQGIEFVWAGEHAYPDDFPEAGTGVTVTGRFESYMEGEYLYVHLTDADVIWEAGASAK